MDPKIQYVAIPVEMIEGVANYLMTRPYREVASFLDALKTAVKPIPGQVSMPPSVVGQEDDEKKAA